MLLILIHGIKNTPLSDSSHLSRNTTGAVHVKVLVQKQVKVYKLCYIESVRRGGDMSKVKEVKRGNTTFIFHDDYCKDTTPEEAKAISKEIAKMVLPVLRAAYLHKEGTG